MSRRRADQMNRCPKKSHGQQAVWAEIRQLQDFTIADIANVVDMKANSIREYVKRLHAGGYVKLDSNLPSGHRYVLIKDTGRTAPRLQKDGSTVIQGGGTASMWRTMRMMAQFSPNDLVTHSPTKTPVKINSAKDYTGMLFRAGYLRVLQKAKPLLSRPAVYKLIRNTGPQPPQIQRVKQVFDPNLGKVVYTPGVDL